MESMETSGLIPHVNQCEFHPYQNPSELREFCEANRIQFEGHCPLAKGKLLNEEPVLKVAEMVGKTPAQVLIRWSLQNNVLTIPKSTKQDRIVENFGALGFELPADCMNLLNNLHQDWRIIELKDFQKRLDKDLPDGYKISKFHSILPNIH
jgi:diketogulonate reductase-like aldo/keto reductase